jgi:hypothetical protein
VKELHERVGSEEGWEAGEEEYGVQKCLGGYKGLDKEFLYVHPPHPDFAEEPFGVFLKVPIHVSVDSCVFNFKPISVSYCSVNQDLFISFHSMIPFI